MTQAQEILEKELSKSIYHSWICPKCRNVYEDRLFCPNCYRVLHKCLIVKHPFISIVENLLVEAEKRFTR